LWCKATHVYRPPGTQLAPQRRTS